MNDHKRASRLAWSAAEDELIREHYGQCSTAQISQQLTGRSVKAIDNRAWRLGVSRRGDLRPWTATEDDLIREQYGRMSAARIGREISRTENAVVLHAVRLGLNQQEEAAARAHATLATLHQPPDGSGFPEANVPAPPLPWTPDNPVCRKTFITESAVHDYFSTVTTAEQAYILGLLAADGNVPSGHPRVTLGLQAKDMRAVEFVRDRLNPAARLSPIADGRMVLQITSRQMVADLARFGIVPRKSRTLVWPVILGDLQRPFLLGYFDGDGSMFLPRDRHGRERPGWTVCSGSEKFLIDMRDYIRDAIGVELQQIQHREGADLWQVAVTGLSAVVVDKWLHQDGYGLMRKRFPEHVVAWYETG